MYDIIIRGGTVIDGSGKPMYRADIGIKEDWIARIGDLSNEKCNTEIDASDRLVCPGFIDVNNHSDTYWRIFSNPDLQSLVYQGITTIIGGNCGSSLAPLAGPASIESIQKWLNIRQVNINWLNLEEFFEVVDRKKLAVNFATLVGHGTLRRGILKNEMRGLSSKEFDFVARKLEESIKQGALGMSSGLIYTHARNSSAEELIKLAEIIKSKGGIYVTHIRGEQEKFLEAVDEALNVARRTGVKLHISHLKVMGKKNWPLMDEALGMISQAQENNIDVTFDVFPYTNTGSVLYTFLPDWVSEGGKKMMLHRLRDPEIKKKLISEMKESDFDYSKIEIAISGLNKTLSRRSIADISNAQGKSVEDVVIDVLLASEGRVITSTELLSEENVEKALMHPFSMISTNGSGYDLEHAKTGELVHPRSFGTFPRVLARFVLGKRILGWEEAIRKMTALPAQKFGLKKRGEIKKNFFADIVIVNRDEIKDHATTANPYKYSHGIDFVLVNGKIVLSEGKYTGDREGKILIK
jgi:N-acyl-D-amino-acid deacylase